MTMTVKLPAHMEAALRHRVATLGKPASVLIREALQAWLDAAPPVEHSAYDAGRDFFGRHSGPPDLATRRKDVFAEIVEDRHVQRTASGTDAARRPR